MVKNPTRSVTSAGLHILAMVLMLGDHAAYLLPSGWDWLHLTGRLAFPIFAFLLVEGYCHTRDYRRYCLRMFLFALLAELPYDLLTHGGVYLFGQNVLWTFLIALWMLRLLERASYCTRRWARMLLGMLAVGAGYLLGYLFMSDYYGEGVLMVLAFYLFRGRKGWQRLGQLVCLWCLNRALGGLGWGWTLLGHPLFLSRQSLAVLALPLLWCYQGQQGHHSKAFRWFCYGFYPLHMLLLWAAWMFL